MPRHHAGALPPRPDTMNPSLRADIVARLTDNQFEGVTKGQYIQKIRCPDCHKREAYARAEEPWMVLCGRMNNCAARAHVKDLFPDLFDSWSERFAPKKDEKPDPLAVARAYLRDGRGFDLDLLKRRFSQEYHHDQNLNIGSATVRFTLPGGATWERLIDKPYRFGKQKAVFRGTYKGRSWQLCQDKDFIAAGEVWIVEGIFDAIALEHHGIRALAAMSCYNYPSESLQRIRDAADTAGATRPSLVWALDANHAGRSQAEKHARQSEAQGWDVAAAQPAAGFDWNDLHRRDELDETDLERYRYYGALLLAASPTAKATLMYLRRERRSFWFEYGQQLWWFDLDPDNVTKALASITGDDSDEAQPTDAERKMAVREAASVTRICTALPQALYYQANDITDESWYYFRVTSPDGSNIKNTFNGGQLASASEFKKRMMGVAAGAIWTGSGSQLDNLLQDQFHNIKTVQTIDFQGYSKKYDTWLLGDVAVSHGRTHRITSEDYFELGRLRLKSLSQSVELECNADRHKYTTRWIHDLAGAYGSNGLIALAFWLGTVFAEQIRAEFKSYPFLEIVGEAGAGKTTIIEFLWRLCGAQDREGFDPVKSSNAARARNFAQVSNLPVVLIESDRSQQNDARQSQFDWDELKPIYNGRSVRARGMKTAGNETYEPPFRGSLVISQNADVQASDAILTRICQLRFTCANQTEQTKAMATRLGNWPMEEVSGWILDAAMREQQLMELIRDRAPSYEAYLLTVDGVRSHRIAKNHGLLLALVDCLGADGLGLIDADQLAAASKRIIDMTSERQRTINADHPVVEEFWEAYDYIEGLDGTDAVLNHYGPTTEVNGLIAVNLKDFEAQAGYLRLNVPASRDLKRYLKNSRSRKFVDSNRCVRSRVREDKTVRCWIFERPQKADT